MQDVDAEANIHRLQESFNALNYSAEETLDVYGLMLLARLTDEYLADLRTKGLMTGGVSCKGHEAIQVVCARELVVGTDYTLPYYRDLALVIAMGMPLYDIFLNHLGSEADPNSGGRMRPAHWSSRKLGIVSSSGVAATHILHAAGIAFAAQIRQSSAITAAFFGEGATSEGDFHEALNFAGIHRVGALFICENNGVALSTPQSRQMKVKHVVDRASAYGVHGMLVDGSNVFAAAAAIRDAATRARSGGGPVLLEAIIPSQMRMREQPDIYDPVYGLRAFLLQSGKLTEAADTEMRETFTQKIEDAYKLALSADKAGIFAVQDYVYADNPAVNVQEHLQTETSFNIEETLQHD